MIMEMAFSMDYEPSFAKLLAASEDSFSFLLIPPQVERLPSLLDVLNDAHDFDTWLNDVTRILRQLNLHRFIDAYVLISLKTSHYATR
jgi:hypothetical protein